MWVFIPLLCGWHSTHPLLQFLIHSCCSSDLSVFSYSEVLFIPGDSFPCQKLVIFLDNCQISVIAHNLEVTTDNQLSFSSYMLIWQGHADFSFSTSKGFVHLYLHRPLRCLLRTSRHLLPLLAFCGILSGVVQLFIYILLPSGAWSKT